MIFFSQFLLDAAFSQQKIPVNDAGKFFFNNDTILTKGDILEKMDSIERKYAIKINTGSFDIDTGRAEIAPIIPQKEGKNKPGTQKDKLPNLIVPGVTKYSFNYLDQKDQTKRDSLLRIFFEEWNKYPVDFIKLSGVKAICFVKNLKVSGQSRYAMPDAPTNTLYYDVNYASTRSDQYLRHSMHHEFYHLIEKNYFGNFYFTDKTWTFFNPLDFSYGNSGAAAYANPDFAKRQYPYKGFITGYATSGIEEDKAEIFGYLMTSSGFIKLLKWIREDPVLSGKVGYFMGFLRGMSRDMDYDYFLRIHQVKVRTISIPVIKNDIF